MRPRRGVLGRVPTGHARQTHRPRRLHCRPHSADWRRTTLAHPSQPIDLAFTVGANPHRQGAQSPAALGSGPSLARGRINDELEELGVVEAPAKPSLTAIERATTGLGALAILAFAWFFVTCPTERCAGALPLTYLAVGLGLILFPHLSSLKIANVIELERKVEQAREEVKSGLRLSVFGLMRWSQRLRTPTPSSS